ncbi:hypothetical protein [Melghirimyces algeriensis]|uniref:Uncharacterized protein n=1 Tax=Melghirimyces algeriensis TaxID=910412 RepID=A0A521BTJ5_9BACL|nr:hypothetical protein [Melghirimyces algeriensis]SMO50477.1 hypothetical protein SAMN06264849_102406 [Melghirimyces algeriensis]
MEKFEEWEDALDKIDWSDVLDEVDGQLLENLANELRFRTYEALKVSSLHLGDGYHITHLANGKWAFWNEQNYVREDIRFFDTEQHFLHFALQLFRLNETKAKELVQLLQKTPQLKICVVCNHHFNPNDPARKDLGIEGIYVDEEKSEGECCSPQCAVEAVLHEMKDA